jgi:GTP-binding protein
MFIDEATVRVRGGRGGGGVIHFLSNRRNPRGGPDGGNGGPGGSVTLRATDSMSTLYSFRNRPLFAGQDGTNGAENNRAGATGADCIVHVPVGTLVRDASSGEVLADLASAGDEILIARGGEGGRGNSSFATSRRTGPRIRERGLPGESRILRLELRIIGFPNAGKSSLLSAISNKRAKIADYPFTTLVPNLGVVDVDGKHQFVAVDVPGLIEGAHEGKGLGDRFLRHIERTRVLVHVIDLVSSDDRDPVDDFRQINRELEAFNPVLAQRPQVVAGNKIDLIDPEIVEATRRRFNALGVDLLPMSVATTAGVRTVVLRAFDALIEERRRDTSTADPVYRRVYRYEGESGFSIEKLDGMYVVTGRTVEAVVQKLVLNSRDAVEYLSDRLEKMGVLKELRKQGYQTGDVIRIGEVEFELDG